MQNLSMCRICLASNVRLCSIASSLQDMYEKLTELTFKREDRRPLVACYICHARLRNCYRLRTSSLRSDELLTEMLSSGELVPPQVSSTNTLRVVSVLHLSLGHVLQDHTECHIEEVALEVTHDAELDQKIAEDIKMEPQEEHDAQTADNIQYLHLEDPFNLMKREADDVESDVEDIKFETKDIIKENEPHGASQSSMSAYNIHPKIVKVVLERMVLNDTIPVTDIKMEPQEEHDAQNEVIQCSHIGDPLVVKKREPDDVETDEDIKLELEDAVLEENESYSVGGSSHSMDNIRPKIAEVVLERKIIPATGVSALEKLLVMETEDVNKRFVLKKLIAKSNINRTVDQLDATLDKHSRNNKVTAKYEVHKSNICSIKKCSRAKAHSESHAHTGEKRFQCNVCNKCFTKKVILTRHMSTHTDEKPFQCDVCNKFLKHKHNLKQHMDKHTAEKSFQCDICNKCFKSKYILIQHMYTHTSEKLFQCDLCNKCFRTKSILTRHRYTHTGERPFHCDVCNKSFKRKSTLTQHMYVHSDEKPYQCDLCNRCFKYDSSLTRHFCT